MMEISKIKPSKKNEQGIALIFTLMILALLLIMGLGFALSSMFSQRSALNAANARFAGFLAQTQLKEITSLIENDEANIENSRLYSHDSGSPAVSNPDMLIDMLADRLPVSGILDTVDTSKVNWSYIRSKDTEQAVIGRTAFVVIAEGIALDALVDGRSGTASYPKHDEESDTETRIGKYVSEINVRSTIPDTVTVYGGSSAVPVNNMTAALNWESNKPITGAGFASGAYTGTWTDFDNLFSTIETAIGSSLSAADKTEFRDNLSLNVFEDKEAFWCDTYGDKSTESNEIYKRFDLTRNWDTADNAADLVFIRDNILLDPGNTGSPTEDMEAWDSSDSTSASKGLPWLATFGYQADGSVVDVSGSFGSNYERRCQIAANLKDYCDTDKRPTSDIDPVIASASNWINSAKHPMFTGNERTPYIDKIGFKITASQGEFSYAVDDNDVWANIEISPSAGLINLYENTCTEDLVLVVKGTVDIRTIVNGVSETLPHSLDCAIPIPSASSWSGGAGYSNLKTSSLGANDFNLQSSVADVNKQITVEVTSINITKAVLHNGVTSYDYTKSLTHDFSTSPSPVFSGQGNGTSMNHAWFGFAVHDPRQNLHPADWQHLTPVTDTTDDSSKVFSIAGACMPNSQNNVNGGGDNTELPSVGNDPETNADPTGLSTAYIRNAPMESPWELGFIHRGAKWETINLKQYNASKAFTGIDIGGKKYLAGGGLYADGDANILDQIKMTPEAFSPQKICLKSKKIENFEALLSKVKYNCTIDSSMTTASIAGLTPLTGSELTSTQATYFGNKIMTKYASTVNPDERRTRSSVVDMLLLPDASSTPAISADTDGKQEELIGKIINLTKIGAQVNGFTAVIIAQAIKDFGTSAGINISKYSEDGTLGSRLCKIGVFDADIDLTNPEKSIYYDEIVAEQKIIVTGYRTIDGKVVITSFQYVE